MMKVTFTLAAIAGIAAAAAAAAPPSYSASSSSPPAPTGSPSPATCQCYQNLNACKTAPGANQAGCAGDFASCAGYSPYGTDTVQAYFDNLEKNCVPNAPSSYPTSTAPAYTTSTSVPTGPPSPKTCECYNKLNACKVALNANQAGCAGDFASCAGYSPYGTDTVQAYFDNLAKYCTTAPTSPVAPKPPVYTDKGTTVKPPQPTSKASGSVPPVSPTKPASPPTASPSKPPVYTGAADKVVVGIGAIFAGALAVFTL